MINGANSRFIDQVENLLTDIKNQQTGGGQQVKIVETEPTDATKNNAAYAYSYDGSGRLQYIDSTIDGVVYRKTLAYDGSGRVSTISLWVEQ